MVTDETQQVRILGPKRANPQFTPDTVSSAPNISTMRIFQLSGPSFGEGKISQNSLLEGRGCPRLQQF